MTAQPRIALIHALTESAAPIHAAFQAHWPEAFTFDLLDTSLAIDRAHAGRLDPAMMGRFATLADYAARTEGQAGATCAILFTCSAFGPAIEAVQARLPLPVLRPNEAAFAEALALTDPGDEIGLIVSFAPSEAALRAEFDAMAAAAGRPLRIRTALACGALAALKSGDGAAHDAQVVKAAASLQGCAAIVLGQFSMARAAPALSAATSIPILTPPDSAVRALRARIAPDTLPLTPESPSP